MTYSGVVSNGGCFQSFGGLLSQVGRGSFWPCKVCRELSWQPFSMGKGGCTHNANVCIESRSYLGAEVEEESTCFAPVALDLSG